MSQQNRDRDPSDRADAIQAFVDALLERSAETADADDRAIERALGQVRASDAGPRRRRFLAAAASTLIAVTLAIAVVGGPGTQTAAAAMSAVIESARLAAPRVFALRFEAAGGLARVEGSLYADGLSRCALAIEGAPGGTLWAGGSDVDRWLVPAFEPLPVIVSDDPSMVLEQLERHGLPLPMVDLAAILERCERDFTLTLADGGRRIRGQRVEGDGPESFELAVGAEGELAELVLEGDRSRLAPGGWQFSIHAVDAPVDPRVFEREHHHDPDRRVVRR